MSEAQVEPAVRTLVDLFDLAGERAGQPFFSYVDELDGPPVEAITYGEFHRRAVTVAINLHRSGVAPGDRVALVALPRVDYVVALAGAVLAGAVPAPINHHFKARELAGYLSILEPSLVVVDRETAVLAQTALKGLTTTEIRPKVAGISGFAVDGGFELFAARDPGEYVRPAIRPDDPALILHSSGTTGFPKAVLRTHGTVAEFLNWFVDYFEEDEHILNFLPLYHQAGLILTLLAAARLGCDFVQQSRYSTSAFWDLVDRYGATHMNLMAPVPTFLLMQPGGPADREHPLRWVVIAGRNDHWADFQDRFAVTGITFYGSTETLQITSTGDPKNGPYPRELLRSVGHGIVTGRSIGDRTEFRLVDELGEPFYEPNREGHVEARGDFMFKEYFHDSNTTSSAFTPDGWFKTGDVGYTTAAGELVLIGRGGGMIRRSGENIAPRELEILLEDHPSIQEAIVIGVPDALRGQEIVARVVLRPGEILTAAEVFEYLGANLSSFKVPRYLVFHDSFERTPTLKIRLNKYQQRLPGEKWNDRTAT